MKLSSISIQNYRGIKSGLFIFPPKSRLICVIGSGDSCKSTLLKAIEWCLWPSWSLNANDLDFFNGDISKPIIIESSISELPEDLLTEDKYGLYLRDPGAVVIGKENDEPVADRSPILTIRLTIDNTLEPVWTVVTNRSEPRQISQKDRRLLSFGVVGLDYDKDFSWGRTSALQYYSGSSKEALHTAYTLAMRNAVENTDLSALDSKTTDIKDIGREYGVAFKGDIHNKLLMQNSSYSTTVGLFDDRVPFSMRGLGSKRLLSIGMNVNASSAGSLILMDEIETGLEPYRLCTLINQLRSTFEDKGQFIFTTHSRSAICECSVDELFVMNENNGEVSWFPVSEQETKDVVQSLIRFEPDAFLCKRIIVCEGKTEIGLLRAFEYHFYKNNQTRFAHYGVGTALGGGGDKSFKLARLLKKCGYDVCVLMDSDKSEEEQDKHEIESEGVRVFSWENGNAIEEQIFKDASNECVDKLLSIAIENKGIDSVKNRLRNEIVNADSIFTFGDDSITVSSEVEPTILKSIGKVAKGKINQKKGIFEGGWYKRIDYGQAVGNVVFEDNNMKTDCYFLRVMNDLEKWVLDDES